MAAKKGGGKKGGTDYTPWVDPWEDGGGYKPPKPKPTPKPKPKPKTTKTPAKKKK